MDNGIMNLSFVIVEYYSIKDVIACYSSIVSCELLNKSIEVVVSSNSDYTLEEQQELITKYSQLKWIFNKKMGVLLMR